ncbi:MAG: hypothetical protein M1831_000036 [Alyxoria varia]|nr:MAG: hypothetical protein M1831_000036 [Alyxoria varia]
MASRLSAPIYTLSIGTSKLYVVNSASMVSAVQRNLKNISPDPFFESVAARLSGIDGSNWKLLQGKHAGGGELNNKAFDSMIPSLLGKGLDAMNLAMIGYLRASIDQLGAFTNDPVDLFEWCKDALTIASTESVYGAKNPYKSKQRRDDFWYFDSNLTMLMMNFWPKLTAAKAFRARQNLIQGFIDYYNAGAQHHASELAYARWKAQHDAGASTEIIARLEATITIGILSNTVPAAFWLVFEIFSRPELLETVRSEVKINALTAEGGSSGAHTVDMGRIRDSCPKLVSTYQEVLRMHSDGTPTRLVMKDVMVAERYLLKAGAILTMSVPAVNYEKSVWGDNANVFNPMRFEENAARKADKTQEQKGVVRPTSFMSFGASPNLCPGRHFATGEILAMTAMMLLRYDIVPLTQGEGENGGKRQHGDWWRPKRNDWALAASIRPPLGKYPVNVKEREEFKDVGEWKFKVSEGRGKFGIITG